MNWNFWGFHRNFCTIMVHENFVILSMCVMSQSLMPDYFPRFWGQLQDIHYRGRVIRNVDGNIIVHVTSCNHLKYCRKTSRHLVSEKIQENDEWAPVYLTTVTANKIFIIISYVYNTIQHETRATWQYVKARHNMFIINNQLLISRNALVVVKQSSCDRRKIISSRGTLIFTALFKPYHWNSLQHFTIA